MFLPRSPPPPAIEGDVVWIDCTVVDANGSTCETKHMACSRRRLLSWGGMVEAKLERSHSKNEPFHLVLSHPEWEALARHLRGQPLTPWQVRLLLVFATAHLMDGLSGELGHHAIGVCANCGATMSERTRYTKCRRPRPRDPRGHCGICGSEFHCECSKQCELPEHVLAPCGSTVALQLDIPPSASERGTPVTPKNIVDSFRDLFPGDAQKGPPFLSAELYDSGNSVGASGAYALTIEDERVGHGRHTIAFRVKAGLGHGCNYAGYQLKLEAATNEVGNTTVQPCIAWMGVDQPLVWDDVWEWWTPANGLPPNGTHATFRFYLNPEPRPLSLPTEGGPTFERPERSSRRSSRPHPYHRESAATEK